MDITFIKEAAQLGGTVFTVVAFLWYLSKRDKDSHESNTRQIEANVLLAKALQRLTDKIEANSSMNVDNTAKIKESVDAVEENTESIKKNTGERERVKDSKRN